MQCLSHRDVKMYHMLQKQVLWAIAVGKGRSGWKMRLEGLGEYLGTD